MNLSPLNKVAISMPNCRKFDGILNLKHNVGKDTAKNLSIRFYWVSERKKFTDDI